MVVRVKVKIKSLSTGKSKDEVVLVNSGAESEEPVVVVDEAVAKELGVWPPENAEVVEVEEASTRGQAYILPYAVDLQLLGEKGILSSVRAHLVIQEGLNEPLITDVTIDALGIQVISFGEGLWKHKLDPPGVVRRSEKVK